MSSYFENPWRRALVTQAYLIAYSAIAAVVGKGRLLWVVIFLFIVLMVVFQARAGKGPLGQGRVDPEEVLAARKLYEEKDVRELQMSDDGLAADLQAQSKATMYVTLGTFIALAYFFLLWGKLADLEAYIAERLGVGERLALFLAFLIYFEGYFVISQAAMMYGLRKAGNIPFINMAMGYTITEKGLVLKGLIGRQAIRFPLPDDVMVELNERRGFVELVKKGKRTTTRIRLYSRSPRRVYDLIVRLNERSRKSPGNP